MSEQLWTEIEIQGRYDQPMWITKIRIEYSHDGYEWYALHNPLIEDISVKNHEEKFSFTANSD